MAAKTLYPPVKWSQTGENVLVTIELPDCKNPDIKIETNSLSFKGKGGVEQKEYAFDIELFSTVVKDESKVKVNERRIEVVLSKSTKYTKFWPRLLQSKDRMQWISFDFTNFVNENSEGEEDDDFMMNEYGGGHAATLEQNMSKIMKKAGAFEDDDSDGDAAIQENDLPDLI